MRNYDTIIIGSGPSGMTAALEIKRLAPLFNILIFEKNKEIGKKLKATGNGKCNITNTAAEGYEESKAFLESIGIAIKSNDNGLVYPYSESAADVVSVFADRLEKSRIEIALQSEVASIDPSNELFDVTYRDLSKGDGETRTVSARSVIVATGGKSGPGFGTIGDGYRFARKLGHNVVSAVPILTSINIDDESSKALAGVRAKALMKLYRNDEFVYEEAGELQFTKTGISGICVYNLTRHMRFAKGEDIGIFRIEADLFAEGDITKFLEGRRAAEEERAAKGFDASLCKDVLRTIVKENLAREILDRAYVDEGKAVAELTDAEIERIAENVHGFGLVPSSINGWKEAQCTSGGVSLSEIDEATNESKLVPGLYFTGEVADYDGPCGGYNLTYAWISGMNAGRAIARKKNESL